MTTPPTNAPPTPSESTTTRRKRVRSIGLSEQNIIPDGVKRCRKKARKVCELEADSVADKALPPSLAAQPPTPHVLQKDSPAPAAAGSKVSQKPIAKSAYQRSCYARRDGLRIKIGRTVSGQPKKLYTAQWVNDPKNVELVAKLESGSYESPSSPESVCVLEEKKAAVASKSRDETGERDTIKPQPQTQVPEKHLSVVGADDISSDDKDAAAALLGMSSCVPVEQARKCIAPGPPAPSIPSAPSIPPATTPTTPRVGGVTNFPTIDAIYTKHRLRIEKLRANRERILARYTEAAIRGTAVPLPPTELQVLLDQSPPALKEAAFRVLVCGGGMDVISMEGPVSVDINTRSLSETKRRALTSMMYAMQAHPKDVQKLAKIEEKLQVSKVQLSRARAATLTL